VRNKPLDLQINMAARQFEATTEVVELLLDLKRSFVLSVPPYGVSTRALQYQAHTHTRRTAAR
tara:strand:- start:814 stop:1002 length:189 start_codon:yes stop_codon:yes gene_type:complete